MDAIGQFLATLHHLVGHDKAAALIGMSPGDKRQCLLCQHEQAPTEASRQAVYAALAPPAPEGGQ